VRSQLTRQAKIIPMAERDPTGPLEKIALFNEDGSPFSGGGVSVASFVLPHIGAGYTSGEALNAGSPVSIKFPSTGWTSTPVGAIVPDAAASRRGLKVEAAGFYTVVASVMMGPVPAGTEYRLVLGADQGGGLDWNMVKDQRPSNSPENPDLFFSISATMFRDAGEFIRLIAIANVHAINWAAIDACTVTGVLT
jgi:hypothetical protein